MPRDAASSSAAVAGEQNLAPAVARPLVLWHLLSLDAPVVAALWTWFVARSAGGGLPFASVASMFLAVWILYAADRLLDAGAPDAELEARHRFHARHRRGFHLGLAVASVLLVPLLPRLAPAAIRLYLELAALLLAWFVLIHLPPARHDAEPRRLPKELAVGAFFAAAIFIPTVAREPGLRLALVPAAALFAALCSLNCLYIYRWEHAHAAQQGRAHPSTRVALRHLPVIAGCVFALAVAAALLGHSHGAWAIALSTALLFLLDRFPPRDATVLRASADLVLLTPLLFLR